MLGGDRPDQEHDTDSPLPYWRYDYEGHTLWTYAGREITESAYVWRQRYSREKQRIFYQNESTGEKAWSLPPDGRPAGKKAKRGRAPAGAAPTPLLLARGDSADDLLAYCGGVSPAQQQAEEQLAAQEAARERRHHKEALEALLATREEAEAAVARERQCAVEQRRRRQRRVDPADRVLLHLADTAREPGSATPEPPDDPPRPVKSSLARYSQSFNSSPLKVSFCGIPTCDVPRLHSMPSSEIEEAQFVAMLEAEVAAIESDSAPSPVGSPPASAAVAACDIDDSHFLYATDEEEAAFLEMLSNSVGASSMGRSCSHSPGGSPVTSSLPRLIATQSIELHELADGQQRLRGLPGSPLCGSPKSSNSSPRTMISRAPHLPVKDSIQLFEVKLFGSVN